MVASKQEVITALKDALEEVRGDKTVTVPVLFLENVLAVLTEEDDE